MKTEFDKTIKWIEDWLDGLEPFFEKHPGIEKMLTGFFALLMIAIFLALVVAWFWGFFSAWWPVSLIITILCLSWFLGESIG